MVSETSLSLPRVDFGKQKLKPGTPEWESVRSQVHKALQQYGCFEANFDKIPLDVRKSLFNCAEELFDLPLETKQRNVSRTAPSLGYLGQNPRIPLCELMSIVDANMPDKVEDTTNVLWPQGNPKFSGSIQSYTEKLLELEQTVRKMILESLGIEKLMDEHIKSTCYFIRFNKYTKPKTADTNVGLPPHVDSGMLAILHQNQVNGLEVQTKDEEWVSFKQSSPDSYVVIIGESFQVWLNGKLPAPAHKVTIIGDETRYSVGLFTVPKADYTVKVPEELIDDHHPLLYKPFNFAEFLRFRASGGCLEILHGIKAYCGM